MSARDPSLGGRKATRILGTLLAAALFAKRAGAAPCGRPDLLESFPRDGALAVPTNATLSAHYAQSAEYLNEPIALEHVGVGEVRVNATFNANEGLLSAVPAAPLVAGASYRVTWPALRGLNTASLGRGSSAAFMAGSSADSDDPVFGGVSAIDWDVARDDDECTDSAEDRYAFDLSVGEASDDGGRDMLTLVVFQTVGPKGARRTSPEPVLVRALPETGTKVQIRRSVDAGVGEVCFAALVRDSIGRVSSSADREVCAKTVRPPFFYGCAIGLSADAPEGTGPWVSIFALAGVLAMRRRRMAPNG
ncbi:MAG TPA: hypothetical protein VJT73_11935 [Polyangiaceae bacterium]|nr:hypothetical protein [Polyangiaceae bacterium]